MESLVSNLTSDHIKLMLTFILAILTLMKYNEIHDQRTGIKRQYQLDASHHQK